MTIVPATGGLLDDILDQTHDIWGEGLSRDAYGRFNRAQLRTAWGATHLERVALVSSSGRLLSSAKRYDLRARFEGDAVRVLGIGAVFTPAPLRCQHFASELLDRLIDAGRRDGYDLAMLFSAIGAAYYRRFGFETVPVEQVSFAVLQKAGAPAVNLRGGEDRDLRFLTEMHEARAVASGMRFHLQREPDLIRFAITRKRLLAGLGPPGFRQLEYFVVDEADRPAAYAVMLNTDGARLLTECGDRDPSGARLGALLQAVLARTPRDRQVPIRAWLPPAFRPPQIDIVQIERPGVVLMLRSLRGDVPLVPLALGDVSYWLGDVV